ncbi:MAG: sodium:proton antiporter [Gammaproteobacteria bacterium]|nr:sodium:proton antiporter [Gammaproteobacteria bacterium]
MHDSSLITLIIFVISGLVALNALSYYSERLMLFPNVIWVLCIGMIYGALNHFELLHLPELYLDPNIILFVLVPILIFAATKKMCLHHFRKVLKESSILATLGIVISMVGVALVLYWVFHVPFLESLLFGVIVSATDPIAVNAILHEAKDLSTERKMLIEGESILNDGFVVAVFATLSVMIFGTEEISLALSGGKLVFNILGALALGIVLGRLARFLLRVWKNKAPSLTVNITLALAFASFLLAETFHFPGVLAVFAGALAFGYRPDDNSDKVQGAQEQVWDYLEYIVNSILFFLLGASFFSQASLEIITITFVTIGVIMLFMSRFIALGVLSPLLRIEEEKITHQDFWLLNFSGSRGAISIALILLLPNDFNYKPLFLTIAFVMVIVSLVVYPIFLKKVLDDQQKAQAH